MKPQKSRMKALSIALISSGLALGAFAQSTAPAKTSTPAAASASTPAPAAAKGASVSADDRKFMEKAGASGIAEVEVGKLGQSKGQSDAVKQYGARMVQDHTKANDELKQIASSKGVTLPSAPDKKHQKKMDELNKKSADKFDHEFMEDMVKDHKEAVSDFRKASKSAKDPDVRNFAAKTLPTLEEHLKLAQDTEKQVKGKKVSAGGGAAFSGSTAGNTGGDMKTADAPKSTTPTNTAPKK